MKIRNPLAITVIDINNLDCSVEDKVELRKEVGKRVQGLILKEIREIKNSEGRVVGFTKVWEP